MKKIENKKKKKIFCTRMLRLSYVNTDKNKTDLRTMNSGVIDLLK